MASQNSTGKKGTYGPKPKPTGSGGKPATPDQRKAAANRAAEGRKAAALGPQKRATNRKK